MVRLSTWTLDEFLINSSENTASRPALSAAVLLVICCYCFLVFIYYYYVFLKSARASPDILSAVKCAHIGDARCVQTAPTDRQTHPAAFPASPLLHPSTSVTLTVRAHLSICCSNCSLGWLSFKRLSVPAHTVIEERRGEERCVPFVDARVADL